MNKNNFKIIFIGGYRGINNCGDHAMALNMIERFRIMVPDCEFYVLVNELNSPLPISNIAYLPTFLNNKNKILKFLNLLGLKGIENFCHLVRYTYIYFNVLLYKYFRSFLFLHKDSRDTIKSIVKSDLIWFGGGGHINDIATVSGVFGTALLCSIGNTFKKKVVMTGQGFGPLKKKFNLWLLSQILPKVEFISVRDFSNSKDILISLGVNDKKIHNIGDDAASLITIDTEKTNKILELENIKIKFPTFGVQLRCTNYSESYKRDDFKKIAIILDFLINSYGAQVVLIPSSYEPWDDRVAEFNIFIEMANKKNVNFILKEYNAYEIKSLIGRMDYFIGFSYHPLVFALTQGIPSLGFYKGEYYYLKIKGLFDRFAQGKYVVNFDDFNTNQLKAIIEDLIADKDSIRKQLIKEAETISYGLDAELVMIKSAVNHK